MAINVPRAQVAAQKKEKTGKGRITQHLGTFALPLLPSNRTNYKIL
jgi:hypothetical protein